MTRFETPLSESLIPKRKNGTFEECLEDIRALAIANPERVISRNFYRVHGNFAESVWSAYVGTFEEFKRQGGVKLTRQQHAVERSIARHASVDHYRALTEERKSWGEKYVRDSKRRFKTVVLASDLHDKEIDPFYLRVLLETCKRAQPDVISLVGDIFDLPEFGKYTVDPREWDAVGRIQYAHEYILKALRVSSPDSQIDLIEGNHEARMLRLMADATPALRAVLSEFHGMTLGKLFRLEELEINYIGKADLSAFTQRDFNNELRQNYRVYYDCLLAHHFPDARNLGLPGVNGHHHKHQVWPGFSPIYGAYEWHQLGAGHRRDASYCNGEKWHTGFALAHVDSHSRSVVIEYVPITDFAVVGGTFYSRTPAEVCAKPTIAV